MPTETVKDNQWWYSKSVHKPSVERAAYIVLSIAGRECPMMHSKLGRDGRVTPSFTFIRSADLQFWQALNGQDVDIDLVEASDRMPEVDCAGDSDESPEPVSLDGPGDPFDTSPIVCCGETLFDAYVFVDWSAASRPKRGRDSIWIAEGSYDADRMLVARIVDNPPTRGAAENCVRGLLVDHLRRDRRVLVGFDFPYGYPKGWHDAVGHAAGARSDLWSLFTQKLQVDNGGNNNNRWDAADAFNVADPSSLGPYWGRPVQRAELVNLPIKKPACFADGSVREFRRIEESLRALGRRPMSVWQLFGNGSVGSQAMLGIPVLYRLRNDDQLKSHSRVWPFETVGWTCPTDTRPFILHAEIWPGSIDVIRGLHAVKDAAQMLSYVRWAATLDTAGLLGPRFTPAIPEPEKRTIEACEGWILGQVNGPLE
ncbi:MAG: hypothetical protein GX575_20755 [Candidatus Anammoximicrobium sp.]|nr:hypothetical protein [Candidatus Anammoximicrobium sp.]